MSADASTESLLLAIPGYLQQLLDEIAAREGFAAGYTIDSVGGANIGDGFQSVMLRTTITGNRNSIVGDQLHLICKIQPQSEQRRQWSATSFRQEVIAYEKLLPELTAFQRAKNIATSDGFYSFPKCYGTYANEEANEFALVLEDLKKRGCRMWNKFEKIDFAHVRLVLTELGKYHALSFALRDQKPELFASFRSIKGGIAQSMRDIPEAHQFYVNSFDRAIGALKPEETELRDKVVFLRDNYRGIIERVANGTLSEPFSVVNHGDCWNNNMMYEYANENDRTASSVCIIDWQMGQYCSPATDLSYFIYTSTEKALRDAHFDDMLRVYYDSLSSFLTLLGSDAQKLFRFADLVDQLQHHAVYALVLAPMLVQIVTVQPEDIPDLDQLELSPDVEPVMFIGKDDTAYTVRMRDVLIDSAARGFFESKHNFEQ